MHIIFTLESRLQSCRLWVWKRRKSVESSRHKHKSWRVEHLRFETLNRDVEQVSRACECCVLMGKLISERKRDEQEFQAFSWEIWRRVRMFQQLFYFSFYFHMSFESTVLSHFLLPTLLTLILSEFVLPNCVVLATMVVGLTVARVVWIVTPEFNVVCGVTRFLFLFVWVCRTGFRDAFGVADCFREPVAVDEAFLVVAVVVTSRRCLVLSKFWAFSLAKSRANTSRTIRFTTSSSHKFGNESESDSVLVCCWNLSRSWIDFELLICSLFAFANVEINTTKHTNFTKEFFIIS